VSAVKLPWSIYHVGAITKIAYEKSCLHFIGSYARIEIYLISD